MRARRTETIIVLFRRGLQNLRKPDALHCLQVKMQHNTASYSNRNRPLYQHERNTIVTNTNDNDESCEGVSQRAKKSERS